LRVRIPPSPPKSSLLLRHGSAEHPRDNSQRPYLESGLDRVNRCSGLPGRRERRRQHRRTPSRCHRSTVAGWISTSASRHRGHNHRKNSQNRRSAERKRLSERARTPSWWRRARVSSRRSRRVARADRTATPVLMTARIACRVPTGDANVNEFWPDAILARHRIPHPRTRP
jgi:hypothetical protein